MLNDIVIVIGFYSGVTSTFNVNLDAIYGPTGPTCISGDKYLTSSNGTIILDPCSNSSVTFTVGTSLSRITGNSVLVLVLVTDSAASTTDTYLQF